MASVRDIALRAGVSAATVSRVINSDPGVSLPVRKKVLTAMNRARYVPKVTRRCIDNVAFAYTDVPTLGSPYDAALLQGLGERIDSDGLDLVIMDLRRSRLPRESFSQMFLRKGIRGAVLRTTARTRAICEEIASEGFPCVVLGERFDDPKVSYVDCESREASREAVEHLIALGHKEIAVCVNVVDDADHADRLAGWKTAMEQAGLMADERLILRLPARHDGGMQLMRRLRATTPMPTAVYITDPMTAVGAICEAQAMGVSVPRDLSIVGFDDSDMRGTVFPKLTAVCQNTRQIGLTALEALTVMIDPATPQSRLRRELNAELEIHDSTAPPTRE